MREYEFVYIVYLEGIEAADHAESMKRQVNITATIDGKQWPVRKQWDRTYEYDGNRRTMWTTGSDEAGEIEIDEEEEDG